MTEISDTELQPLTHLGLSDRQISVYRALLSMGPSSIRDVAAHTGINRGTTYETLKQLAKLGVTNYQPKGKRRVFQAEPPEKLMALAEGRKHDLEQAIDKLKSDLIPQLKLMQPMTLEDNVRLYEGDDGVELVLRDILSSIEGQDKKSYSVISTQALRKHLYRPFPNFTKQRIAKGIFVRVLAIGAGGEEAELAERKWIQGEGDASYIAIYPPKVAMISLSENNYPVAVVIDSRAIANTQEMMFDLIWQSIRHDSQ